MNKPCNLHYSLIKTTPFSMTVGERGEGGCGFNQTASTVEVDEVWFMHILHISRYDNWPYLNY